MRVWLLLFLCVGLDDAFYRKARIPCPAVVLSNGRVRFRQKSGFAQFQCFKGYLMAGEKYSRCVNGQWDSPKPKCVRASCQKIKAPANGLIHASHRGAVLNFFCRPGYELNGPNMTSCDGRVWDTYLPTCLPTNVTPSLSCDFETEDLCGWSHDLNHNFDWTRMNLKTPSGHVGTGPAHDHTKGETGNGYYMYIEASSRNVNDTARLISPVYQRQSNDTCLEFYYHMYGITTGQLRVYVKKISEPWTFQPESAIFWKSGNHGDEWLKSWTHLGPIGEDFQIIFEGVRGARYISDIAIDDVKIVENCPEDNDVNPTTESETYAADTVAYGTCAGRCDASSNVTSSDDCDCNDACAEKNSCCPDYIAICILGDFSTDYFETTSEMDQSEDATDESTIVAPSTLSVTESTTTTTTSTTTTATTAAAPTTVAVTSTRKPSPTTKRTRPTSRRTTAKSTSRLSTTPPLIIINEITRAMPTTTTKTTEKTRQSEKMRIINDIATIPYVTEEPEVTVPIMIVPDATTEIYDSDSEKAATIKKKPKEGATGPITIAVIAVCAVTVGALLAVFIARKYSRNSCLRMKKMKSGNGDSQSDVRFLTSDEILDFTLATPDDYNTF